MKSGWSPGAPVLVEDTAGGVVRCRILGYEGECFYKVRVEERGHAQHGWELVVHEDDATLDLAP